METKKPDAGDKVLTLPGLNTPGNRVQGVEFAGYMPVTGSANPNGPRDGLFYWFAGTEDYAKRPLVIWTNGGPGSSSFWGFFLENGPYKISFDDNGGFVLKPREFAWNQYANYMIFEHPLSVTLSFAADEDVPKTVEEGMGQYYQALLNFFVKHPELAKNPVILAGESYAGTYLPLLAKCIVDGNAKLPSDQQITLAATVLLDAWVNPEVQMATDTTYAYYHGLISAAQKELLDKTVPLTAVDDEIGNMSGVYMANIALPGDPPFDPVMKYLNDNDFRKAVNAPPVGEHTTVTQNWSPKVSANYTPRVNESFAPLVQELLDDTDHNGSSKQRIMVISGLNDAKDCNFLGTEAWLNKLEGLSASEFRMAGTTQWVDHENKRVIGFEQNGGRLSWLKVLNAGHLAVLDQPLLIHYILERAGV